MKYLHEFSTISAIFLGIFVIFYGRRINSYAIMFFGIFLVIIAIIIYIIDQANIHYHRGWKSYQKGDYRGAIAEYNRALRLNPKLADAYFGRGIVFSVLGELQQAIEDYDRTLHLNPNFVPAYFGRGSTRSYLGDHQGAIEDFTQLIRLNPTDHHYYNRGVVQYLQGNYHQAIADFTQALNLNPNFVAACYNRGNARYELGDEQGAFEDYTQAMQTESDDFYEQDEHGYYARGLAYYRQRNYQEAIADLQKAEQLSFEHHNLFFHQQIIDTLRKIQE